MRIGEVAKITGLSEHTLRFYDKQGLLPKIAKKRGGVRDFSDKDMRTLSMIECLKKTGMPLGDIKRFIDWCAMGDKTIGQRYDMFIEREKIVKQQLADIKKTLKIIEFKKEYYARALRAGTLAIYDQDPPKMPEYFE